MEHMGNEREPREEGRPSLALGGSAEDHARSNPIVDRRPVAKIRAVFKGERISLPVRELDGATTGVRMQPAPSDGYYVEEGEASIFVHRDVVEKERRRFRRK